MTYSRGQGSEDSPDDPLIAGEAAMTLDPREAFPAEPVCDWCGAMLTPLGECVDKCRSWARAVGGMPYPGARPGDAATGPGTGKDDNSHQD